MSFPVFISLTESAFICVVWENISYTKIYILTQGIANQKSKRELNEPNESIQNIILISLVLVMHYSFDITLKNNRNSQGYVCWKIDYNGTWQK